MTDPLSIPAGIIAVLQLTRTVVRYLNDVTRAPEERRRILEEIASITGILTILEDLAERPQWGDSWSMTMKSLNVPNGPLEQFRSALERLALKLKPVRPLKRVERSLVWPFQKREVYEILRAMERQKTLFDLALQSDYTRLSQAIRLNVEGLNDRVDEARYKIEQVQIDQTNQGFRHQDEETQKILAWLSPLNFFMHQSDIIDKRQSEMGLWLLESEEFKTWSNGTRQTLFCPGIPGAGKTMLASIVIQQLPSSKREHNIGLAYLFCNYRSQLEQTPVNMLASLLRQLIPEGASGPDELKIMHQKHINKGTRPALDEVSKLLLSQVESYSQTFIVVDALDEYPDDGGKRELMLAKLRLLQVSHGVNLMVTSRYIPKIMEEFEYDPQLKIRASEADVRRYLDGQMFRLARCVKKSTTLQEEIKDEIVKAVDGMFLLAQLHLDSLTDKMSIKDVKAALKRLSKGGDALGTAYANAMERIDAQQPGRRELAKQVLSWITYAKRHLTLLELQHALAVELEEPCLDLDNLKDEEDMVSVCAGLVTVDQESSNIRLVHHTTQEYLERIHFGSDPGIQKGISATCLTYLSFDAFECGYCATDEMLETLLSQHPLLDYAAKHWGDYVHWDTEETEIIKHLALTFLENENKVSVSGQVVLASARRFKPYGQEVPRVYGIHLCAILGLKGLMMALLSSKTPADLQDSDGRTPLLWAAEKGHKAVVELLLDRDDIVADRPDRKGRTPLFWAAEEGHETVIKLLLDQDDVVADRPDKEGRTPLFRAAGRGHKAVVKLLLDQDGVIADRLDEQGGTPLSWAAEKGHEEIVKLLLDRDDVVADRPDRQGGTPLSWAAENGHEAVIKLLLNKDVVADRPDEEGRTPLSWAAEKGHEAVVQLLLIQDDVVADYPDRQGWTPLSAAVMNEHEAVIKLLLDQDVVADRPDGEGRTPLSWAATNGHEAIVKLLLDQDVVADRPDEEGRTPLSWAAEEGHEAVVKLLLDQNVVADRPDEEGRTPLSWAAEEGHEAVVKLLQAKLIVKS